MVVVFTLFCCLVVGAVLAFFMGMGYMESVTVAVVVFGVLIVGLLAVVIQFLHGLLETLRVPKVILEKRDGGDG